MPGIYIHIPFCRQKCRYCNFFSVATLGQKTDVVAALAMEIELQQYYLEGQTLGTIYFGGGTPSLLDKVEIASLLKAIYHHIPVVPDPEITLEANPDNITSDKLNQWKALGINRLSIGIQSFFDDDLKYLGRIHNGQQAADAIKMAQDAGFGNLSIDFIYGIPTLTEKHWETNLKMAFDLGIPHISAYALTVEEKTPLHLQIRQNILPAVDEQQSILHFKQMMEWMNRNGYQHYEISNFCLPGRYSRHNTSYWKREKYLGIGPSAHSFNLNSRQWNTANISNYLKAIDAGHLPFEREILTSDQQYNEYVMTSIRTMWGCSIQTVNDAFGQQYAEHLMEASGKYIADAMLDNRNGVLLLTNQGKLFADRIAADLFIV